jgi:hypothetical protein
MRSGNEPRKGGRPALSSERKKSQTLTFRTRADLRKSLEAAAEQAGRSISEEVEYRLQRSFDREALVQELYGDQHANLLKSLSRILSMASGTKNISGGKELSDQFILSAMMLILGYENRKLINLLDPETLKASEISAASEIVNVLGIDPSEAKKRARGALSKLP